jgi:hypothetical protein
MKKVPQEAPRPTFARTNIPPDPDEAAPAPRQAPERPTLNETPDQETTLSDLADQSGHQDASGNPGWNGGGSNIPRLQPQPGQPNFGGQGFGQNAQRGFGGGGGYGNTPPAMRGQGFGGNDIRSFGGNNYNGGGRSSAKWQLLILILVALAVLGGTAYLLRNRFNLALTAMQPSPTPVPTVAATPSPTPVPTPSVDRAKFKVQVLNGTDKSGLAGTVADKLKGLGYQMDKSANATSSAFKRTEVRVKKDNNDLLNQLIKDLSPDYDATAGAVLKATDTNDAQVILGTQ